MQICTVIKTPLCGLAILICYLSEAQGHAECGRLDSNDVKVAPWNVNIYQINENGNHQFICSGTLVSPYIILTAARCFYNDLTFKLNAKNYSVTVGQQYKAWTSNAENAQLREISSNEIILSHKYGGIAKSYSNNLAIVKLRPDQKIEINSYASKACVYWDNDFNEEELEENTPPLKVLAWKNSNNATLEALQPWYISPDTCRSFVPKDFQTFLTVDKMCVQLESVLVPSIGSGLYAYNKAKSRWYLIGVTSEVVSVEHKAYVSLVKLNLHLNWLSNQVFLYIQ